MTRSKLAAHRHQAASLQALTLVFSRPGIPLGNLIAARGSCSWLRGCAQRDAWGDCSETTTHPGRTLAVNGTATSSVGDCVLEGQAAIPSTARLQHLLSHRRVDEAWAEFMRLTGAGVAPEPSLCDGVIAGLCSRERYLEAKRAYGVMRPLGYALRYNTYQAVLKAHLVGGDLNAAMDVFRDLQRAGMAPNQVTYCQVISALCKQRRRGSRSSELAYELWRELEGRGGQLDAASLRAGMKACVDAGRSGEAEQLLRRAERGGGRLDVRAYNILLKAHARAADVPALQAVLRRMEAAQVAPSPVTYNTLVDGYVQAGALGEARACMAAATAAGIELDAWSYTSIIKSHVQGGDMVAAEAALLGMQAAGVKPTFVTYSTLVDGHVRRRNLEAARRVLAAMLAAGEAPSAVTYNSLLRGYAADREADALRQALRLLDDMQARGVAPAADTFNTLMSAAVDADDAALAVELHRRMQAAGLVPDGVTYTVLIQAHSRLGQVSEAVTAFEALSRDRSAVMDLTAYNAMVDAFARAGDMTAAESMLATACAFAQRLDVAPPVEAYGAVVAGYARLKLVQPAVDIVRQFHAAGGRPDEQMMDMLVDLCVRTGEYKMAMQAVRAMELLGTEVDKAKYKALVLGQMQRQKRAAAAAAAAAAEGSTPAPAPRKRASGERIARERKREQARDEKNVHLERFKFWLGFPNSYYD